MVEFYNQSGGQIRISLEKKSLLVTQRSITIVLLQIRKIFRSFYYASKFAWYLHLEKLSKKKVVSMSQ